MTVSPVDRLTALLEDAGYDFVEPPLLHDADLFLDLAGEDLRRRMFLTATNDGVELCLRPDYTIPVALHHLTSGAPTEAGAYAYCGPVFRQRPGETGEFRQAGVESIGRADTMDADADILALALKAVSLFDVDEPTIRIGDSALFAALLESLDLPDVWRRRLARAFGDNAILGAQLDQLSGKTTRSRAVEAVIEAGPGAGDAGSTPTRNDVIRHVEGIFASTGAAHASGRSAGEIADRFLEQASLESGTDADIAAAEILQRFLAISGTPDEAALALGELAAEEAPELAVAVERFTRRTARLVGHGIDTDRLSFSADFGRRIDYYTGFVFELGDPVRTDGKPVAGGGRYDRLLSLIRNRDGTGDDVPAVGFALWLDRLEGASS